MRLHQHTGVSPPANDAVYQRTLAEALNGVHGALARP